MPRLSAVGITFLKEGEDVKRTALVLGGTEPSECSAVWLAHLIWDQGVVSSNLTIPTTTEHEQSRLLRRAVNP